MFFQPRADNVSVVLVKPPLSPAIGYAVVVAGGLSIALGMVFVTEVLKRTVGENNKKTEVFMTANRSVRTGLTTSAVISSLLWSTALLGSTLVGYNYGVAGPFWFAAGSTPLIAFFAILGISCKSKIPEAHTSLEIVKIRYGTTAHIVYMFLCLLNNIFAVANMLLGASAAVSSITGMNIFAATLLIPVGVIVYTFVGGLKATFLTDYVHTFVILSIACFFTIKVFTVKEIGSLGQLYDLVAAASTRNPISQNHDGSYLTMTSKEGMYFGITHICSSFGLIMMDTSFFIKAFSASPSAVVPGYLVGGVAHFAIPWCLGTLMSSVALGLEDNPIFPTYPRRMSPTEVSSGLVLPYAAITIAGKGGAIGVLLMTFMAVTSTISAQILGVSSIISFDIYRTYINKRALDADIIRWSHYAVIFFGLFAAAFCALLHYVGIDLGWSLYMLGVITSPGIFPTALTILWRRQSKAAAIISPLLGMATGITVWLYTAHTLHGRVTIASTGAILPCVYGTVASTFSPLPYTLFITLLKPQQYDWADFQKQRLAFEVEETATESIAEIERELRPLRNPEGQIKLKHWGRVASVWAAVTFLAFWVLWPLPMYASKFVFTKGFYSAWLVIAIIWLWITMLISGLYPLIDGRRQLLAIYRHIRHNYRNKKKGGKWNDDIDVGRLSATFTPSSFDPRRRGAVVETELGDGNIIDDNGSEVMLVLDGKKPKKRVVVVG